MYARTLLLAGLVLSPVLYRRDTVDVFSVVKLTILFVTAVLAVALWIILAVERGLWLPRLRVSWAAGAFLAAQGAATACSQNLSMSVLGVAHRYGGLIPFVLYATIALTLVALYWERPAELQQVPRAIALASFVVACDVVMQKLGLDWIPWRSATYRPTFPVGTFGNSNFAGGFLAAAAPLFLYVVLTTTKGLRRGLLAAAFALDLAALWFTQTRGALIGVGLAVVAVVLLAQDRLPRWLRRLTALGVAAGAVVFVAVVIHPGMSHAPSIFSGAGDIFRTGTFQDRSYYWIAALRIFRHHPVLGTGPDTYAANYPLFRLPQDGAKLGLILTDKPHNIFLEYAANSGALGLGSYLSLLGLALAYAHRQVRHLAGHARLLLTMFAASLVVYLGQGFFSIDVPPIAVMGWVALAGIAVLSDPGAIAARQPATASRPAGPPPAPGRSRWLAQVAVLAAAAVLLVFGLRPYWADHLAHNAQVLEATQGVSPDAVAAAFGHAAALAPLEPSYRSMQGDAYETAGDQASADATKSTDYAHALIPYRQALRLQPRNVFFAMNLARVHTSWAAIDPSHYPVADGLWQAALRDDPTDWQVHEFYALMLTSWATITGLRANGGPVPDPVLARRSVAEFGTVVRINPKEVTAWVNLATLYRGLGEQDRAADARRVAQALDPTSPQVLALPTA